MITVEKLQKRLAKVESEIKRLSEEKAALIERIEELKKINTPNN